MAPAVAGDPAGLWSAFAARAELVGAAVRRAESESDALRLVGEVAPQFTGTASLATRFPLVARQAAAASAAGAASDVVCSAVYAVAETGSVALDEPRADRGACFLAERLWVVVSASAIVATLEQAMLRMRDLVQSGARHPLLMTGPSRTADIERTLTVGVHGPRALVIVVVAAQ